MSSSRILIVDLSLKQKIHRRFEEIFEDRGEPVYVPGFEASYPSLGARDVLLITGSEYSIFDDFAWLPPLMEWVRGHMRAGGPTLGICYGHQLIVRVLLGTEGCGRSVVPEMTYVPIEVSREHPLFEGLPRPFLSMSAHYDEVTRLPEGFEALARSEHCAIQAMAHRTLPIVGLQFHPEMTPRIARRSIQAEEAKLAELGLSLQALLAQVPDQGSDAARVLTNFVDGLS